MEKLRIALNSVRGSCGDSGSTRNIAWNYDNSLDFVIAGKANIILNSAGDWAPKDTRTKIAFTMPQVTGAYKTLTFTFPQSGTSKPYGIVAYLSAQNTTYINEVLSLSDAVIEPPSTFSYLAKSVPYSDENCSNPYTSSSGWTSNASEIYTVYYKFDLSNVALTPGQTYYIYIVRNISYSSGSVVYGGNRHTSSGSNPYNNHYLTLSYEPGVVYIYNDTTKKYEGYIPYIHNGTKWEQYTPYIYDNGWKTCN